MSGNTYTSSGTLQRAIDDMQSVANPPNPKTLGKLEAALTKSFAATQAATHVITASLKGSGKKSSEVKGGSDWEGTIAYGGVSPGPNNPVDYAIYEMARGDAHDFFSVLPAFYKNFEDAVASHGPFVKGRSK